MSSSIKPIIVLIPGSFGPSKEYDPVALPLREKGYTIHVLDPPCYPPNYKKGTPPPSMYDDAKFISKFIAGLADKGEEVVLVAHSYGGIPATQSLEGITKKEREAAGKKGGVVHIGYMTCLVPKVGQNLTETIKGGAPPMDIDEDGWLYHTSPPESAAICFNSLSPEAGLIEAKKFGKHSSVCFGDALTYNGHKDLPASWFHCEDDKCILPEVQELCVQTIEESWKGTEREGQKVDVRRVKCDHVPTLSATDEVVEWIAGMVEKNKG